MTSRNAAQIADIHSGAFDNGIINMGMLTDCLETKTDWQAMWRQRGDRLMKLAAELEEMTRQRDMLARRCAEQANHIAGLISLQADEAAEAHPLQDAIATMQKAGIR